MRRTISLSVLFLIMLLSGCITSRQHMYTGQLMDVATTAVCLNNGFSERNPVADDLADVALLKIALFVLIEGVVYLLPETADTLYKIGAIGGYSCAAWNTTQFMKYQ